MMSDAHGALVRMLLARGGEGCRLTNSGERPWASITFEGARHVVEVELPAAASPCFLDGIEDAVFDLRCHLLADLAVTGRQLSPEGRARIRIEALTLVDH